NWQRWVQRFSRFRQASDLSEKSDETQINTLIYTMGPAAEDILASLNLTRDERKKFDTVKAKFDAYFVVRRNIIYERAKFNQRKQLEGESVDLFITSLYGLVEHCGYGDLHDEMIRDRLVVGLRDEKLAERLQLDPDLTLEKAVTQVRQTEIVRKQQSVVRNDIVTENIVGAVHGRPQKFGTSHRHEKPKQNFKQRGTTPRKTFQPSHTHRPSYRNDKHASSCSRCGFSPSHPREKCPARDKTCSRCHARGHFIRCCRLNISEIDSKMDTLFLGTIGSDENSTPWMVDVKLNGSVVNFKIDTGADVTVVPNGSIDSSLVTLRKPDKILYGPGGKHLHVCGMFRGTLSFRDRNIDQEIYVVEGLKHSLLGRPAIEKLELLLRINSVQSVTDVRTRYPELFEGLGKLAGEYTIKLREDAHPVALTTPRRVPIPLLPKVKTELARMEQLGVIEKIDEPSEWCSGMVVVQKPKGGVRICVDLTQLNESVQREIHPMPAVDITLGQLAGAKFFSRLDANSGFWQVQLSEDSAKLTTFITPFGRYFFRRLPFGISSAPEYFQKQMSRILEGQKGVVCQTDDVLVHGSTKIEHDTVLDAVLQKLKGAGVTLNAEKCEFFQTETNFLGHIVNENGIRPDPNKVKAILEMSPPTDVSEMRYAQVEKEALASTWACERFSDFLIGSKFLLETDHKPLVSLLGTKSLCDLPPRVQRFRMRLMRFTYDVIHIPGKELNTPDALSRAPISEGGRDTKKQELETDAYVSSVVQSLPATRNCLDRIRDELKNDSVCAELIRYISTEWPQEKSQVSDSVRPYWNLRGELTVNEELLMKGCRLVIPVKLQGEFLEKLHEGHLGITKCRERAKISIWWPGLSTQIKELVSNCYK
ncbi:hypothetical protein ScPMuIL_002255, partial [Solemya velum]